MLLNNKIHLCYVNMEDLWQWIEENNLLKQDFTSEKEKWTKEVNQKPNFFLNTELILIYQDIIVLKTFTNKQVSFLAKTYQLEYQTICQKLFQANKNIIIVTDRQWKIGNNILSETQSVPKGQTRSVAEGQKQSFGGDQRLKEPKNEERAIVLLKDKENIEKSLVNWLKEVVV